MASRATLSILTLFKPVRRPRPRELSGHRESQIQNEISSIRLNNLLPLAPIQNNTCSLTETPSLGLRSRRFEATGEGSRHVRVKITRASGFHSCLQQLRMKMFIATSGRF
jgi:hypothetical protein